MNPNDYDEFLGSREITSVPGLKGNLGKKLGETLGLQWMKELKKIVDKMKKYPCCKVWQEFKKNSWS